MNFSDTFNGRQVDADEIIQTGTNVELGIVRFATAHARFEVALFVAMGCTVASEPIPRKGSGV